MSYVSRLSDVVRGGVAGADMQEGRAVRLTQSGIVGRNELPIFALATAGTTTNVFCLMAAVDDFPRPTKASMYTTTGLRYVDYNEGYSEPIRNDGDVYQVGMSVLWNPTIPSGALAQGHRGGTYAVPSGAFVDSSDIRVPGNMIAVGADGRWTYTATAAEAVGYTEEYNVQNEVLIFTLKQ
jgi:hypothetical protein